MQAKDFHRFDTAYGSHVLLSDGSRILDVPPQVTASELDALGLAKRIDARPMDPPPLYALSLNLAQACNMNCTYCYAGGGPFGGKARTMSREVAFAAVDRLLADSGDSDTVVVGFMGGEPLLARDMLRETTQYASMAGERAGKRVKFSMTTNLTLARDGDLELFRDHDFNLTVSIDGNRAANDAQRQFNIGGSAYDSVVATLERIAEIGRPRHLSARVTVARDFPSLLDQLRHVIGLGFDDAGFAPVLSAPERDVAMDSAALARFLEEMIACGQHTLEEIIAGRPFPFANFETAMFEIHRGSHRPYPCGAGAGYLSVNADGELYACHRLIDDDLFAMGTIASGADVSARHALLTRSHIDTQEPCRGCWARYLCGGGCHHEVRHRGRPSCDYIRGWLDFCLKSYVTLQEHNPRYFAAGSRPALAR